MAIFLPKGAPFFDLLLRQNAVMRSVCALIPHLMETGCDGEKVCGDISLYTDEQARTNHPSAEHSIATPCDKLRLPDRAKTPIRGRDLRTESADLEEEGDAVYLSIIKHLSQTFITPIDREDILGIAKEQERLTDLLNNLVARLYIFNIRQPPSFLIELSRNLNKMALLTSSMLRGLSKRRDSHDTTAFRALRDDCETLISSGLEEALDVRELSPRSVLLTLKLARAYDRLEQAIDQVADLAEALEESVLKHV